MSIDNELERLSDPPIPDGSDPTIDDDGTISHEERDNKGRIIRNRPDYIHPDDRVAPFDQEEQDMLTNARNAKTRKGLLILGSLLWLNL